MTAVLSTLVGSRICHDLISPIGAISNGIELLSMTGMETTPELALIRDSVENANARIRMFRIAFGAAGEEQTVSNAEAANILETLGRASRCSYHWDVTEAQARADVRLAFLLVMCLETALPYGGEIHVMADGTGWRLTADAERMQVDPALWRILEGQPAPDLAAAQVHFLLLAQIIGSERRQVRMTQSASQLSVVF
ncbi:histidine phosphotransferase [Loktanella sp. IMCC34160]|uniref:histidine phosphotransferase family protein n=1 Tax=Loktanella sp. IMCC34160 TaxID=2510646 RepID=UPI00101DFEED|nr:histidine phosphotransferase family protein [Loktanella sp. IMCC34160]RYG92210.1 histidine phosphotransferase [Loktanella sp. IMCC34160]